MNGIDLRELYQLALLNDQDAIETLLRIFHPHIVKNSFYQGRFDSDCYQELSIKVLDCIKMFQDPSGKTCDSFLSLPQRMKIS